MKTYISSRRHDAACAVSFGRRICSAVLAMIFAFVAMSFVSCTSPTKDVVPASLVGTWESQYDSYKITEAELEYDDGGYGYGFVASIEKIKNTDETSGIIYLKVTKPGSAFSVPSEKYYATAYKSLSENGIQLSNAYSATGKAFTETLEEAESEFTVEKGYYSYYGEYAKKK